jgi:two-component system NtrC family sensor kinase
VQTANEHLEHLQAWAEMLASRSIDWHSLSDEEKLAGLWVLFRSSEDIAAAVFLDRKSRRPPEAAYTDTPNVADGTAGHLSVTPAELSRLLEGLAGQARRAQAGFSSLIEMAPGAPPVLPLRVPVAGDAEVVVFFSLSALCAKVLRGRTAELVVFHEAAQPLCQSARPRSSTQLSQLSKAFSNGGATARYLLDGQPMLGAAARTALGWTVVVQQPISEAFAASHRIRDQTLFWVATSLLIALVAGWLLARGITRPLGRLIEGTEALAQGRFDHRIRLDENDEFGRLAQAFDHMSEEIAVRDAEIRQYNEELQDRVLERTADLIRTHEQLLQSQRVAAVGALGAGLAEEVNDSLTGVLGVTQLVLLRARQDPSRSTEVALLERAEQEGLHIREVVSKLQYLTKNQGLTNLTEVAPNDLLDATLGLVKRDPQTADVRFSTDYAADLPKLRGNFMQLQRCLLQILSNAVEACAGRIGEIRLQSRLASDGGIEVLIQDNGSGIEAKYLDRIFEPFFSTAEHREGRGMGLAIAARIVEDHHGRITVESEPDVGTTVILVFPASSAAEAVA